MEQKSQSRLRYNGINQDPNNTTIEIGLVDDHIILRDALAAVVDTFENCKITLLANNGIGLKEKLKRENLPDLIILDLNMPEMNGFETAKWLRHQYPEILVLILTMYESEIALIQLLQAGVRGFLKKDIHPSELKFAIKSVVQSGYYYSHNATGRLVNLFKNEISRKNLPLNISFSKNELEFLTLACTDLTYKEIAQRMNLSPRTVDNYRDSLFMKLSVKSRVGLAIHAIKCGMVTLSY